MQCITMKSTDGFLTAADFQGLFQLISVTITDVKFVDIHNGEERRDR